MLKSYFKVAFRTFSRNRLITFINVFGLGLAMSVGMMIMIRFQFELGFDSFHANEKRVYRITSEYHKKSGETWRMASTSLPLQKEITDKFSDVEKAVNLYPALNGKVKAGEKELYLNGVFTEPAFFDVFGFTLSSGNAATALTQPNSIVISPATAERYFGEEDPMGKLFTLETGENFIVTGVLNEPPSKSQLLYDAYASWSSVAQLEAGQTLQPKSTDWFLLNTAYTFVLLPDAQSKASIEYQLGNLASELNKLNTEGKVSFYTQALSKINPSWQELGNEMPGVSPWTKIIAEVVVSLIILLAACFNYTNLTIARAITRAREVGVRKINGARRSDVFVQYIIEALSLSILSLCFAWLLLSFIIRYAPFNDGYEFIPSAFRYSLPFVLSTVGFALFAGLLAGIAPAWILSSFSPLRVLKNLTTAKIMGKVSIQKALIVFQYSLSLTIIIFLLTFYRQFSYMGSADPGYKRDGILVVSLDGINKDLAAQKINTVAGVRSTGAMSAALSQHSSGMFVPAWVSDPSNAIRLNYHYADGAFVKQMELKMLAGKNFSTTNIQQPLESVVINEAAANNFGFKRYTDAVGQRLQINDSTKWEIAGVVSNFAYENMGIPIKPLALRTGSNAYNYLYVQADKNADNKTFPAKITAALKTISPAYKLTPTWLEQDIRNSYSQTATISLLGYLAFMATAIASLGLLGLVIYTVQVKRKEISVRKIIGATEKQLVVMLSKKFVKLLLIAGLIAIPIGYTGSYLFLLNFVNRVNNGVQWALFCFLFLLGIGLFTIISQTYKAAIANPANDLRTE